MKFTVLVPFKHDGQQYEEGNTHDTAVCNVSDGYAKAYQQAGIVHIDGQPDQPLTNRPHVLNPDDVEIKAHG